jgi:hypothetical protein
VLSCIFFGNTVDSHAEDIPIERCGEYTAIVKFVEQEIGPRNFAFSLKNKAVGMAVVFMSERSSTSSEVRWRILERQGDQSLWCLAGSGKSLEILDDMHTNNSRHMYGMPGSGHKRCASGMVDGVFPASVSVRMWANQELGKTSTITALTDGMSGRNFVLLVADDGNHWVLLSSENGATCYRSRGDGVQLFRDYTTAKPSTNPRN